LRFFIFILSLAPRFFSRIGFTGCGKNVLFRHSERSEESLFDLSIREQTKRDSSLRSEWQRFEFFCHLFSLSDLICGGLTFKPDRLKAVLLKSTPC
jgi:hypothetical protein